MSSSRRPTTAFWLELIVESGLLPEARVRDLAREADELTAILVATAKQLKSETRNQKSEIRSWHARKARGRRWLLAFETAYGTAPASGYTRTPFASTSLGSEQPLITSELLGYGRDPLAPIKDAVTADGDVVVPIDAATFGFWLKAAFGEPLIITCH